MTPGESIFSFIKDQGVQEEAARNFVSPVPPPAPRPAPPQELHEDLRAKLAALEAKVIKLEGINSAAAAASAGLKAESQALRSRSEGLEREIAVLKKMVEDSVRENRAGREAAIAQLKKELDSQSSSTASLEEMVRRLDPSLLNSMELSVSLFEGRLKNLEAGLAGELKARFAALDTALGETVRKAGIAQETAAGSARRVEKMDEKLARLPYLENMVNAGAEKLGKIYEVESLAQFLKLSVEGMEKKTGTAMSEFGVISAEQKKACSDLEALSRQVRQLTALFNQFRVELAFLMPKKQESSGC